MLKFPLPQRGRVRFYWDGASLQAYAEAMGDLSLNWLDFPGLVRAGGLEGAHVWIAPARPQVRADRETLSAYEKALGALGVERRAAAGHGIETECLRCGHGWREERAPSGLMLGLTVLADAMTDAYDAAFVFAPAHVTGALDEILAPLFPHKRPGRVIFGRAGRQRLDGPVFTLRSAQVAAARLFLSDSGRRTRSPFRKIVQPAAVEASP